MCLREVQEVDRKRAPWGKSSETLSERRNLWMSWSTPARQSLSNSQNTTTIRNILYVHLSVCRPSSESGLLCKCLLNFWCCSDPWPRILHWVTWHIRTSALLAVSKTKRSLLSRLRPTPNWRFLTQTGWERMSVFVTFRFSASALSSCLKFFLNCLHQSF